MKSALQPLANLNSHSALRLVWEIAYARNLAPLGKVKLSAGTAQNSPLKAMPSSQNPTQGQYKSILCQRLNAWPNPSIERTNTGKPVFASHLKR